MHSFAPLIVALKTRHVLQKPDKGSIYERSLQILTHKLTHKLLAPLDLTQTTVAADDLLFAQDDPTAKHSV